MTIKRMLICSVALLAVATITLTVSLMVSHKGVLDTREAQRIRNVSLLLAEELKESSRSLTSAVQKFTVTGDEQYAEEYMDIVLIRSGEKPRPDDREIAPGELISLNELMRQANFTENELNLLQLSADLSDRLISREIRAMNAVRGLFPNENGEYTIIGEPDKKLAMELIFSPEYENEVSLIMGPINVFDKEFKARLTDSVDTARGEYDSAVRMVWIVLGVVVIMFASFMLIVALFIVRPILMCDVFAKQVTAGNFDSDLDYTSTNEIGSLAASLRSMLKSLLERIDLEAHARYFDAVIANADAGVIIKDKDGLITDWNTGAEEILGYAADEMCGKSTYYYTPESGYADIDEAEARLKKGESTVRVDVVRKHKNGMLIDCSASYTPIFDDAGSFNGSVAIFHDISDRKQMEAALKDAISIAEERNRTIVSSISYASKIQRNLLPQGEVFDKAFTDHFIIWEPRDIVGGDIYWMKNFDEGSVLCVCDCTGHGTPGALLTMLVASSLETIISERNYKDTADILSQLDNRLANVLNVGSSERAETLDINDGCDLAVLFIAKDGSVTFSSGNINVFVSDGSEVTQIRGQRLFVGEGDIGGKEDVKVTVVPANPDNKFYIASDGLYDQKGGELNNPYGYRQFSEIILKNHNESQTVISKKIWDAFESYRGGNARVDDVELITFKP